MKRNYLFLATAILALASCSENTYLGDQEGSAQGNGAISFGSNLPTLTRAEDDHAKTLKYKFAVYATKTTEGESTETTDDVTSNVFATNPYPATTEALATYIAAPYWVWWENSPNGTASNTKGWEYVGAKSGSYGTTNYQVTLTEDQTIKYWDYSAKKYEFVAYSATVTYETTPYSITKYNKDGFTITATAAELAGLYVADKITINSANNTPSTPGTLPSDGTTKIGDIVQFTFRSSGAKVRLGIYETINGYVVKNVNFRPYNESGFTATTENATLSGSFNGTSSSASGTYNVTYNSTTGVAEFDNTATTDQVSKYFEFGALTYNTTTGGLEELSTSPTWANGSSAYQSVLPNTDNTANMILYVDYDLYNDKTGETIHVKRAKAVVPQMYMTWKPNHAYTYLFKISDNTNGKTGDPEDTTTPEGLYPITFDAVTEASVDGEQGTITTVSTPAITTYQDKSVSNAGITYANANGDIYITVNEGGTLATLTGKIKLYKLAAEDANATEADLILVQSKLTGKEVTGEANDILTILSGEGETVQGIKFAASTSAKFTPAAGQTYAVEYTKTTFVAATGTFVSGTTYYTDNTGATTVDTTGFTAGTTDVSSYFVANNTKHYKVIKIKATT